MWRTIGFASLTAGLLAFLPTHGMAQKKNKATPEVSELATDKDYKLLHMVKDMTGKLAAVNSLSITFRLDIPHMEPNPNYKPPKGGANNAQYQQMQNIYRQQAQIMATRNPVQQQIKMQQLMATIQKQQYQQMQQAAKANSNPNNQPFRLAHVYKDFDLDLSEKVVIRKMFLETDFDDKGNIKTYTKDELAELRGKDTTKPGYKAKIDDLQSPQYVKIHLAMPKKNKPASEKDKAEDKAADKGKAVDKVKADDKAKIADKADQVVDKAKKADKADDKIAAKDDEVEKPIITMIVILQALDAEMSTENAPSKKKKAN